MARVSESTVAPGVSGRSAEAVPQFLRTFVWNVVAWLPVIALLILWEIVARSGAVTPFMLPSLTNVFGRIAAQIQSGDLAIAIVLTLWRALAGFAIAAVLGIAIGLGMARNKAVNWFFDPIVSIGFPIPKIAFLPILTLWLGFFDTSKIVMIAFNTIFPVITATIAGVYSVEKEIIWSARNLGTGKHEMLWKILLPAAMPQIFTGLQVALPIALIVGILTEMAMGGYGIGGSMQTSSRMADSLGVFAGIVEIAVVGYLLVKLMAMLRRHLLKWHQESQEATTV
jgi:ABC-type nitrate/sulfonate/bicarbonate transport system permease component